MTERKEISKRNVNVRIQSLFAFHLFNYKQAVNEGARNRPIGEFIQLSTRGATRWWANMQTKSPKSPKSGRLKCEYYIFEFF